MAPTRTWPLQVRLPEPTRGASSAVTAGEAAGEALQSSLLESNGGAQEKAQGILLAVWKKPFKEDEKKNGEQNDENNKLGLGFQLKCQISDCKDKAMALTRFCHKHILKDTNQMLYRGCNFPIKSGQLCKKPILRSINPPHCPVHAQAAEKHLQRALKRAGLNVSSPSKLAPKLHVVVAEYVRQIQSKRREAQRKSASKIKIEEKTSES